MYAKIVRMYAISFVNFVHSYVNLCENHVISGTLRWGLCHSMLSVGDKYVIVSGFQVGIN